jgi:putative aldouronate transport system permease protein
MTGDLWKLTFNTIAYNIAFIILGNILQIAVAIMLNELRNKWFKKISQTLMFLPHFISAVLVGLLAYNILSYDYGILNSFLKMIGMDPVETYSNPAIWPYYCHYVPMAINRLWIDRLFRSDHGP